MVDSIKISIKPVNHAVHMFRKVSLDTILVVVEPAVVEAIPTNPALFLLMAVLIGLIVMFYMESKKNVITSDEEE